MDSQQLYYKKLSSFMAIIFISTVKGASYKHKQADLYFRYNQYSFHLENAGRSLCSKITLYTILAFFNDHLQVVQQGI